MYENGSRCEENDARSFSLNYFISLVHSTATYQARKYNGKVIELEKYIYPGNVCLYDVSGG